MKTISTLLLDKLHHFLLMDTIKPGLCENSPLPHNKKMFLADGVAIPPYSGTTKIKPSELSKFFEIEFKFLPKHLFHFFCQATKVVKMI